jgi:hypothetical protein
MSRFFEYDPNQAYLLPPNLKDVLGSEHLCFQLHAMVDQLDVGRFEEAYAAEGRMVYPPRMLYCDLGRGHDYYGKIASSPLEGRRFSSLR